MGAGLVRLDVRWAPETVRQARRVAEELGVKPSVVLRRAAELGLTAAAAALRAERETAGLRGVVMANRTTDGLGKISRPVIDQAALTSEAVRKMGAAGAVPPDGGPPASVPVPAPAASPARGVVDLDDPANASIRSQVLTRQKLVVVVSALTTTGRPQPIDVARARRRIELGKVAVDGRIVLDPDALVSPAEVALR